MIKKRSYHRLFRNPLILATAVLSTFLLGGCAVSGIPMAGQKTRIAPAFALPCNADNSCAILDPCADMGFEQCGAFDATPGLYRKTSGSFGTLDFRAQVLDSQIEKPVSLWHDIPLIVSDDEGGLVVNVYMEVSKGSQAKVELNKWAPHNPIWQDREGVPGQTFNRPRYYAWSPAPGNYGALPRTWENVLEPDPLAGFPGDTDPIDVVDIGSAPSPLGLVYKVKVIGALGMIDGTDQQMDWKIFTINVKDPRANQIDDISDMSAELRNEWGIFWRFYKTAKGLEQNFFYDPEASDGISADPVWLSAEDAGSIVKSSAAAYRKLKNECLNLELKEPYWVPGCEP